MSEVYPPQRRKELEGRREDGRRGKRQRWRGGKKEGKERDTWSLGDMESHIHDVQAVLGWDVAGLAGSATLSDTGSDCLWWLLRSHLELLLHLC